MSGRCMQAASSFASVEKAATKNHHGNLWKAWHRKECLAAQAAKSKEAQTKP